MDKEKTTNQDGVDSFLAELFLMFPLKKTGDFLFRSELKTIDDLSICIKYLLLDNEALRRENRFLREK